ncbi:cytochrome P450 [Aliidiomarina taiwanensis]|uniref:Cytochrome P450 n=1 Tax=Aliidiomarina taiwanensis TaxID=946228 RepID=A0A432X1L0_9GAMM|nr:cytochrome P450 [Aliidiomarina taiwanensis]RUO40456.1 cytochrome P450 [Aliidiomarina taiwanensis]
MPDHMPEDLSAVGRDLRAFTDELRSQHAVVKNNLGEWVLLRHKDVVAAAKDDSRFSSAVSRFLQIPNGLDGEEHSRYRALIDTFLTPAALQPFVPVFEEIAAELVQELMQQKGPIDAVNDLGAVFAVRAQCAWLGWPSHLEQPLLQWMKNNHAATRSGSDDEKAKVAQDFDNMIKAALEHTAQKQEALSVTQKLQQACLDGRLLTEAEVVSILRNWTGGDLGSMALCIGVLVAYLVQAKETNPHLFSEIAEFSLQQQEQFINEVLRIDCPFVSNRRVTRSPVHVAGVHIPAGARVKLNWTSANRDESVFAKNEFDPKGHAANNLVYGVGKHVCPGQVLATWQLRIVLMQLIRQTPQLRADDSLQCIREVAPLGGYERVPVHFI